MNRPKYRTVVAVAVSMWCLGIGTQSTVGLAAQTAPTRIEFRRTGDDGLTMRFADALEQALRKSGLFILAVRDEPRTPTTVIVTIVENLHWHGTEQGTMASYKISFQGPAGQPLGNSLGSCSENDLSVCVARALRDTKRAAAKLQ
jgi:hypothetical protein